MKVSGASGANTMGSQIGAALGAGEDAQTKSLKNQIARVQKQLQELSANEEIGIEEKMKKRQELQKQLTELNGQLRQHQIEQRRKASEEKKQMQSDSAFGTQKRTQSDPAAESLLSADAALKQAKVQGSVATGLKGRAGVLESEIKMDGGRGGDTAAKQEELSKVEGRIADVRSAQAESLSRANKEIEEGRGADRTSEADSGKKAQEKTDKAEEKKEEEKKKEDVKISEEKESNSGIKYKPIDILL